MIHSSQSDDVWWCGGVACNGLAVHCGGAFVHLGERWVEGVGGGSGLIAHRTFRLHSGHALEFRTAPAATVTEDSEPLRPIEIATSAIFLLLLLTVRSVARGRGTG